MTSVPPDRRQGASVPETLADWFQLNSKYVAIGAGVIAAAALGYWFYNANAERTARVAEQQLLNARRALVAGNVQLGQSDLKKVVEAHGSTRAGVEAALLLAEALYRDGKFQEGIDVLDDFTTRGEAEAVRSKIYSLIGDGHMELEKPAEAAESYANAAEAARFDGERAYQLGKRARALVVAGDTAAGAKAWGELADSENAGVAAEARVRVGELNATVASKAP